MVADAYDAGIDGEKIPEMTPAQVRGMFQVEVMRRKNHAADMDRLSWLNGSYAATAFHAPKRYPNKPRNADRIMGPAPAKEMTDAEMKSFAMSFAKRWNNACKP